VTVVQKLLAEMGTQETRPTSYENSFHVSPIVRFRTEECRQMFVLESSCTVLLRLR
jgi:hypothetical protein